MNCELGPIERCFNVSNETALEGSESLDLDTTASDFWDSDT
jgi:hypothetical protein